MFFYLLFFCCVGRLADVTNANRSLPIRSRPGLSRLRWIDLGYVFSFFAYVSRGGMGSI